MRTIALIILALTIGTFFGMWYGSRDRACAALDTDYGHVILCSNSYNKELQQ